MSSLWRSSSTSESESGRGPALPIALFLALAAAVAGCTAFDVFRSAPAPVAAVAKPRTPAPQAKAGWTPPEPPSRIAFNHQFHLGRGPVCADCHEAPEPSGRMAMPTVEFCMNCHEEIDAKKPKEKTIGAFLDEAGKPRWSNVTAQSPDVSFDHAKHLAKKLECANCHQAIEQSTSVGADLFVTMDACVKCHTEKQAKTDCATCHKAAAKNVAEGKGPYFAPGNHDTYWRAVHGSVSRLDAPRIRAEKCEDCHAKQDFPAAARCDTCHAATKPASHDAAWRGVHGAGVRSDPASLESCAKCHESAQFPAQSRCDVCHVATKPANHAAMWKELHGQTVRRDPQTVTAKCAFCHDKTGFPPESRCSGCHRTEAPRDHSQSWRVSGGHGLSASMDRARCAACHTPDTCQTCHATVTPKSHRAGWGAPRDRHCTSCHLPLRADAVDGCGVCHQGTPSHASAPPMPSSPPHRPDLTCRKCHYRLEHADNGTNCVTCHR